jgi:predicted DNA-binding transcriptional regulator AlpA
MSETTEGFPRLLTVPEADRAARVSVPTMYRRAARGDIPGAIRVGESIGSPAGEPREPLRPSGAGTNAQGVERAGKANAQTVVAHYVDLLAAEGSPAPKRLVGQVARQVGELAKEGIEEALLERAVEILVERRLNPATLPSLILEAAAGPGRRPTREHEVDRRVRDAFGLSAEELLGRQRPDRPALGGAL